MRYLFLLVLFISCNQPLSPEVASDSDSSGGGTEVVGGEVQAKPTLPTPVEVTGQFGQTNPPSYIVGNILAAKEYRIILNHPSSAISISEIMIPGHEVINTNEPSLFDIFDQPFKKFTPSTATIINFELAQANIFNEFHFYFALDNENHKPNSIKIEAKVNDSWVTYYQANNQNDARADFYMDNGATVFRIQKMTCPESFVQNNLGQCSPKIIWCSDIQQSITDLGLKPCKIKRDNVEILCSGNTDQNSCQQVMNNFCQNKIHYIEFNNQMFEVLYNNTSLGTIQCPN